jgi:TRAP-type C4-dicarboxylate transport system permease small subunit
MESKRLSLINGVYNFFPKIGWVLANLAIVAMTILVTLTAISRYVFNWTPGWADSVCAFLVAFTVFMGAGYALIRGDHVRITFVFKKLPLRIQNAVELVCGFLALLYVGYLIYSTSELALMSYRLNSRTPDGIILSPLQIMLPIGLLMLFVSLIGFILITARKIWNCPCQEPELPGDSPNEK